MSSGPIPTQSLSHPSLETIRAYATGRLARDNQQEFESHISTCLECCVAIEAIPDDTLTELLRSASKIQKPNLRLVTGYEFKGEIGRGGMGVVYLATQPALGRDVALKMISHGEQASFQELARFRKEGQAIALLHHPNIAQVYEVGEQQGQPYIAMELVRGGTLAQYLRSGPLSIQAATKLTIQIADAVAHAHSRGVIHRDLKPSNILLSEYPETHKPARLDSDIEAITLAPKIVDFGLAKLSGLNATVTLTGILVGTPSYMSPEQAAGKNDTVLEATDVYAIGAILYELLVGRPPFQGSNSVEILEQVRTLEPVRPKALRPGLPHDLETICLKCLEKAPASRYQSASDLHADLKRFLEGKPIKAKPCGRVARLIKWTKRHPAIAALTSLIAIATVGLFAVSLIYNHYLSKAFEGAEEERLRADMNFRFAFDAVDRMLEQVGFSELANQPGMEPLRESLMQDAVKFYSSLLAKQPSADVDARRHYGAAMAKLGRIQSILGHLDESRASLENAIEMQNQLCVDFPNRHDIRHELATSHINLGLLDKWSAAEFLVAIDLLKPMEDAYPVCKPELAEALNLYASTLPPETGLQPHLNVLAIRRSLLTGAPSDPHLKHGLGQTLHNVGHTYYRLGQNELAVDALEEALKCFEELVAKHGEVTDYQASLAECLTLLAAIEHDGGRAENSGQLIERSIGVRRLLVDRFPQTPLYADNLADSYLTHTAFLIQLQNFPRAVEQAESAVQIAEHLTKDYPTDEYQFLVTSSRSLLATALGGAGRLQESQAAFETACTEYDILLDKAPQNLSYQTEAGVHFMNYSNLLRLGVPRKALEYNKRSVELLEKVNLQQPTRVDFRSYLFNACGALAQSHEVIEDYGLAADVWERAIAIAPIDRINEIKIARGLALVRACNFAKGSEAALQLASLRTLNGAEVYNVACLFGLLDKLTMEGSDYRDHAFELLNRPACIEFLSNTENLQQLKIDHDLESIRSDERFQQLLNMLPSDFGQLILAK